MGSEDTYLTAVVRAAKERFSLSQHSIHGVAHWQRVRENGLRLAEQTGANPLIVELFAFLHDCCRQSDCFDPKHGPRAAEFARDLRVRDRSIIPLEDPDFEILCEAIENHTIGRHHRHATIATCWDADRLDIGRVGRKPHPRFLSTEAARAPSMIEWAWKRSRSA